MTYRRPVILAETIRAIQAQTRPPDRLLIVDNDPAESARPVAEAAGVGYLALGENTGPAGAAAAALRALSSEGWEWIWWGDDDNPPTRPDALERLLVLGEREAARTGVPPLGGVSSTGERWDWGNGRSVRLQDHELCDSVIEIDVFAGNHNPMLRREVIEVVGLPNALLFFGFEEREYALRIRKAGFRLVVSGEDVLALRRYYGFINKPRRRRVFRPLSGVWRDYYSYRNSIYIHREVLGRPLHALRTAARAVGKAIVSYRNGWNYGSQTSRLLVRAAWDGLRGTMGQQIQPVAKPHQRHSAEDAP